MKSLTALALSAVFTLAFVLVLEGNPPTPASGVVPRAGCDTCDCGCNEGGACLCAVILAPDKPTPEPKKEKPIAQIAGPSTWGDITQNKSAIEIQGNEIWFVNQGEIRKDGKLLVFWILRSSGAVAPGLYDIHADGSIDGMWGWGENVTTDPDGTIHGLTYTDTLRVKVEADQ